VPIGGEDLTGYRGAPRLTIATGDEPFDTIANGEPVLHHAEPGEVVWRDDAGVTCRRWNWRQCVRTRLTIATTDALFIIDGLGPDAQERSGAAADDLQQRLLRDSPGAVFLTRVLAAG
jgi:DNA/RNA-binding domain of Phe-tRNA-synthetase-like protein